jgi:hypothetical protein
VPEGSKSHVNPPMITLILPPDWQTFVDGRQTVSQGPEEEEVIISRSVVTGAGASAQRDDAIRSLHSAVLESMHRSASQPDLVPSCVHDDVTLDNGVVISRISSMSPKFKIQFEQFALSYDNEVLLLTYEVPIAAQASLRLIERIIESAQVETVA